MKTEGFDLATEQGIQKESLLQVRKRGHNKTKYHHNMDAVEKDWTAEVEVGLTLSRFMLSTEKQEIIGLLYIWLWD